MANCEHLREIIDLGESSHVCYDCGLVLDKHYEKISETPLTAFEKNDEWAELAKDILDRHHISTNFSSFIIKDFNSKGGKKHWKNFSFHFTKFLIKWE